MAYRKNVTDLGQTVLETQTFSDGIPVHTGYDETKVVAKGRDGSPQRTQNAGTNLGSNAGVIMNADDQPNRFMSDLIGRHG